MSATQQVRHEFIELLPEKTEDGVLYVSLKYKNMIHLCLCGCGSQVVTPLSPTGWSMTFDGQTVSVYPSIGSWKLPCRSHYWIWKSRVQWVPKWTYEMIEAGLASDAAAKGAYDQWETEPSQAAPVKAVEAPRR